MKTELGRSPSISLTSLDVTELQVVSVHPFGAEALCTPAVPIPTWDSYNGDLKDDLLAHYTFDNDYLDTSGNNYHSFEFGNPIFISDGAIKGQALSFDGIDDYVELPNIPELGKSCGVAHSFISLIDIDLF